jgi:hypothetical protein
MPYVTVQAASQVMAAIKGNDPSATAVPELLEQVTTTHRRQAALLCQLLQAQRKKHARDSAASAAVRLLQSGRRMNKARLAAAVAARLQRKQLLQLACELMERMQVELELAAGQPA